MTNWVLSVELDGEWEECSYATHKEAMEAFVALANDYRRALRSVVLAANRERDLPRNPLPSGQGKKEYVN